MAGGMFDPDPRLSGLTPLGRLGASDGFAALPFGYGGISRDALIFASARPRQRSILSGLPMEDDTVMSSGLPGVDPPDPPPMWPSFGVVPALGPAMSSEVPRRAGRAIARTGTLADPAAPLHVSLLSPGEKPPAERLIDPGPAPRVEPDPPAQRSPYVQVASNDAFDPAAFAAFKARGPSTPSRPPAPTWSIPGEDPAAAPAAVEEFDPAAFASFKAGTARHAPASFDDRFGGTVEQPPLMSAATDSSPDGLGHELRRVADERLVGKPDAATGLMAATLRAGNAAALNLPRNAAALVATGLGKAGVPGYPSRSFTENYDLARDQEEAIARQSPKSALAGTVNGVVGGAVALPAFAPAATMSGRIGQAVAMGAGYGGAAELFDKKTGMAALEGVGYGAAGGLVGGYLIEKAAPVVAGLIRRGAPLRDAMGNLTGQAMATLRGAGIEAADLTPQLAERLEAAFAGKGASPAVAREAQAADQGITLSTGQATGDPRALAIEGRALAGRSGGRALTAGQQFAEQQAGEISAAGDRLQAMAAGGFDRVPAQAAFEAAADRARLSADDLAGRQAAAQRGVDDALRAVRGRGGVDAIDGASAVAQALRDAAARSRAGYQGAYDEVAAIPGSFVPGALDRVGTRVRARLGTELPVDDVLTPAATRALADLDDLPGVLGLAPGEGPTLAQSEQVRRRLLAYRQSTGANATDREAMRRILSHYDDHVHAAADAGLFVQRPMPETLAAAPSGNPAVGDAGFPGFGPSGVPGASAPAAPARAPETMAQFIARNGGLELTDDARAADLHKWQAGGLGRVARPGGLPIDDWRDKLVVAGFLRPDHADGSIARDIRGEVFDALHAERVLGRPTYRMEDEAAAGSRRIADGIADQNADHAAMVDRQARRMAIDLEGVGLRAQDLDREALSHAAERMVFGHADDAVDAYEAALTRRGAGGGEAAPTGRPADDVPFPDAGGASGAADAFPAGDTSAVDAMGRARALFREHQQAFKPRGVGDVAGQRLQRIVERDASPNEVATMLFGSPGTGRVSGGQLQTLARVRDAVGADSEAWQATQQALIARHLGGEGRDLGQRLDNLLRGEGRTLARFLSKDQRAGLARLRGAVTQAENAAMPVPTWATDLERSGFDPNRIASGLFGGAEMGSRVGAANEARAARAFLGADSREWAGLRQATIARLMASGEGAGGAGRLVDQIAAFTNGSGKGVAETMFSPGELSQIRQLGAALRSTLRPDGSMRSNPGAGAATAKRLLDGLVHAVALGGGGLKGVALTYGARVARDNAADAVRGSAARRSFQGGAPRVRVTLPTGRLGTGLGLAQQ